MMRSWHSSLVHTCVTRPERVNCHHRINKFLGNFFMKCGLKGLFVTIESINSTVNFQMKCNWNLMQCNGDMVMIKYTPIQWKYFATPLLGTAYKQVFVFMIMIRCSFFLRTSSQPPCRQPADGAGIPWVMKVSWGESQPRENPSLKNCDREHHACSAATKTQCSLHIHGLVQKRCNSSVLAMELRLSCINPSIWSIL